MNQAACEYHEIVNYESDLKLEEAASWAEANYDNVNIAIADAARHQEDMMTEEEFRAMNTVMAMKHYADDLCYSANAGDTKARWIADKLKALAAEIERRYD